MVKGVVSTLCGSTMIMMLFEYILRERMMAEMMFINILWTIAIVTMLLDQILWFMGYQGDV